MDIRDKILLYLQNQGVKKVDFCRKTGIANGFFNKKGSVTSQNLEAIFENFQNLSPDWLLTGNGEMLRNPAPAPSIQQDRSGTGIPLVETNAVAGFGNANFAITEADVKAYYIVPKFRFCHIDFMIEISGSSMYPKYNSGDVVACTILHERSFIQWNKCHIISSREQGILCKRLRPSDKDGYLTAISDNPEYPPFDIPESDILGIALVVGVIRLE